MKIFMVCLVLACIFGIIMIQGCHKNQLTNCDRLPLSEQVQKEIVRMKIIYKSNWLVPVLILAVVLGGFAALNGCKWGMGAVASAGLGLFCLSSYQAFSSHPWWPAIIGSLCALLGLGAVAWSLFKFDKGFIVWRKK